MDFYLPVQEPYKWLDDMATDAHFKAIRENVRLLKWMPRNPFCWYKTSS